MIEKWTFRGAMPFILLAVSACGGGGGDEAGNSATGALRAAAQSVQLQEDTVHEGTVTAEGPSGPITFHIAAPPAHGQISLEAPTGRFSYTPAANFFGTDSFSFSATGAAGASAAASVTLHVAHVDDPPAIDPLPDAGNLAYQYEVVVPLTIREVDGEPVEITVTVENPGVVGASVDSAGRRVNIQPRNLGTSRIVVAVDDGTTSASSSFNFRVQEVARNLEVRTSSPATHAIALTNTQDSATEVELTHNGHHAFATMEQILAAVRGQPDAFPNEGMPRKIWRFVRDNTYHASPANVSMWMNDTWPVLNSFGWGFCSNVSAVYRKIAEAAGYEARIWGLYGHVVPEILVDGQWQMFDPDLAVYYHDANGNVANVTQLAANPQLVSSPVEPILAPGLDRGAYGQDVADIYSSTANNRTDNPEFSTEPFRGSRITLPPNARLIYPGRWTEAPTGYDGPTPSTIEQFRQARLELAAGTTGTIGVPWVLWDIQGSGRVRIADREFAAGSPELHDFLVQADTPVTDIEVLEGNSGLALIMIINPLWYDMLAVNALVLTGKDVWAIQAETVWLLAESRPPPPVPESLRKPGAP